MTETTVIIIDNFQVTFDFEALERRLRVKNDDSRARLRRLADEALGLGKPRAAAKLGAVEVVSENQLKVDDTLFTSSLLIEKMGQLGRVFPYFATEGPELAEWGHSFPSTSLERFYANTLQNAAMKQAEARLEKTVTEKFGIRQVSAMNPGSLVAWPIMQQAPLFELLAPLPEQLGVTLLPTFMMQPEHSVSGIYFQSDTKFFNCQLCPRDNCPNRKAPRKDAAAQ